MANEVADIVEEVVTQSALYRTTESSTGIWNTTIDETSLYGGYCHTIETNVTSILSQLIMAVIIIILNLAVIRVIYTGPARVYRRPAFFFITSLAVSDILVACFVLIATIAMDLARIQMTAMGWGVFNSCSTISFSASVFNLLLIAADRLCYIAYNHKYMKYMTKKNAMILIAISWTIAIIPISPTFAGYGTCGRECKCSNGGILTCDDFRCSSVFPVFKKSYLFSYVFVFLVIMVIIIRLYYMLFKKVRDKSMRVRNACTPVSRSQSTRYNREFRLARTLAIVIGIFFACWFPIMMIYTVDFFMPEGKRIPNTIGLILALPTILNSLANPIIYAARMRRMRNFLCPCCKGRKEDSTTRNRSSGSASDSTRGKLRQTYESVRKGFRKEDSKTFKKGRPNSCNLEQLSSRMLGQNMDKSGEGAISQSQDFYSSADTLDRTTE